MERGTVLRNTARLLSIGTAVPAHILDQQAVAAYASELFSGRYTEFDRLSRVFETAASAPAMPSGRSNGIAPRGWPERTAAYLEGAQELFVEAAEKAWRARADGARRRHRRHGLVDRHRDAEPRARVFGRMGFRADVAARAGLRPRLRRRRLRPRHRGAARRRRGPASTVLLVAVELCTLAFRLDKLTKAEHRRDGAVRRRRRGLRAARRGRRLATIEGGAEHTWPDTLDIMGWSVDPQGFGVIFARAIPPFVAERARAGARRHPRAARDRARDDIGRFVCHPGGAKVDRRARARAVARPGALDHEREVLRDYGNMSAPTVLFVLERVIAAGLPERAVLTAMGPGFTASCASLTRAA